MTNLTTNENSKGEGKDMQIDIGEITAAGNVVIAGRDAVVYSSTSGTRQDDTVVRIGGVEAKPAEVKELQTQLSSIDEAIKNSDLDDSKRQAAQYNASLLKEQMTSESKANEYLLEQTTDALLNFGPDITGAVVGAFTTPLAGKITSFAGERALALYRRIRAMKGHDVGD